MKGLSKINNLIGKGFHDHLFLGVIVTLLISLMAMPLLSFASERTPPAALSLQQLISMAIQHNKNLTAAKYNVSIAKARLIQAGLFPNPTLELAHSNDRLFNNEGEYATSVGFSQDFPIAGRIGRQKKVARIDIVIAKAEIRNAERQLAGEVAASYYQILIIDRRIAQLNRFIQATKKLSQVAAKRHQAAEVSEIDRNTTQLEWQGLVQQRRVLQSLRITEVAKLNELLGRWAQSPLTLKEKLPPMTLRISLARAEQQAFMLRPDLKALMLTFNRANAGKVLAKAQRWADWTVGVGVEQSRLAIDGAPPQRNERELALSLSVPLPLFNRNQGRILEASAVGTQALVQIKALRLRIQTEVVSAYTTLKRLLPLLHQSERSLLPLGQRNFRIAAKAYRSGQMSLFEVVQVQRQQNDLQLAYLNTLDQYLQAWVRFKMAIGEEVLLLPPPRNALHDAKRLIKEK